MRTVKGLRYGWVAGVAVALVLTVTCAVTAQAQDERFTTERPGSILIFPKVIRSDTQQTTFQITNTSNMPACAHCFYVNAAALNGIPAWQVTDFELCLTRQQPTHWDGNAGRQVDPMDSVTGIDPGNVPPLAPGFMGGLVCAQVNTDGSTTDANALKGEATIASVDEAGGIVAASKYNAVAIQGIASDGDNELKLDNVEYAACPAGAHLNFQLEDGEDAVLNGLGVTSAVSTTLALMPCSMDLENLVPGRTTLSFDFRDEFESPTSLTPVNVDCWSQFSLGAAPLQPTSQFWYARIEANEPFPGAGGFVGVANVQRVDANGGVSTAATNLHFLGNTPGTCELAGTPCTSNGDCTAQAGDSCLQNFGDPGAVIRLPATAF